MSREAGPPERRTSSRRGRSAAARPAARDRRKRGHDRLVDERTKWLALAHELTLAVHEADTTDEALRLVLSRTCASGGWDVGCVYLPDQGGPGRLGAAITYVTDERFAPFGRACRLLKYAPDEGLPGRVYTSRQHVSADGQADLLELVPRRAEAAARAGLRAALALPVTVGRKTIAVMELFSDRPHPQSGELAALMSAVGAPISRVLERERVMAQVAETVWREQQDLVHTLHDSLGQELTGVGMMSSGLAQRLADRDPEAAQIARTVADGVQRILGRVRQLARGLFSLEVQGASLMPRLEQLATASEAIYKIPCRLEYDTGIRIQDDRVATQLYRIAQEAVTNALRHAKATRIAIHVRTEDGLITLSVADNGVGIQNRTSGTDGMGLRIMRHRAISMGAAFSLDPGSDGGTEVTCSIREARHLEP